MSTQENEATFRRVLDAGNSHDEELFAKAVDEAFLPGVAGAEVTKKVFAGLFRAFPDLHITVEDVVAEGDRIVIRNTVTGTHRGEYLGLAATGRSITYSEIFIIRFVDGRVAETWGVVDVAAQMKQLGLIPA
jgi:steroid delta-isomerase-like uncharacterized protein